jgi:hypothetical protein
MFIEGINQRDWRFVNKYVLPCLVEDKKRTWWPSEIIDPHRTVVQ